MKFNWIQSGAAVALGLVLVSSAAEARNPHCAGGIQYVVQGMRDKEKGNTEDYLRQMEKAVVQLKICSEEDPKDFEAVGYLGWALAESDRAEEAGEAFEQAIVGLTEKGDKKKASWASNNRDSYWATAFNDGIGKVQAAQELYPEFTKKPADAGEEALRTQAGQLYDEAIVQLRKASLYKRGDPRTLRNLGTVYAFKGEYAPAIEFFQEGLKHAPEDEELLRTMASVRSNQGLQLVDQGKYDDGIKVFQGLIEANPEDATAYLNLADALFKRARDAKGEEGREGFKQAGDAYAKAGRLQKENADLPFNAALAYQNAREYGLAEGAWRATLEARPQDGEAMSGLGSVLAELKKYDEAITVLHKGLLLDPKSKNRHRQLGAVYAKAGNNPKGTEELMVYLALENGAPVADPAARAQQAKKGDMAATLAKAGAPEDVVPWEADGQAYETWFYWTKGEAYHFQSGTLIQKSEWSSPASKTSAKSG